MESGWRQEKSHKEGVQEVEGRLGRRRLHDPKRALEHNEKKRMLEDRGAMPREEGDLVREYKDVHEENFL